MQFWNKHRKFSDVGPPVLVFRRKISTALSKSDSTSIHTKQWRHCWHIREAETLKFILAYSIHLACISTRLWRAHRELERDYATELSPPTR